MKRRAVQRWAGDVRRCHRRTGIEALKKAELMGAMLPWATAGLNLPESIYQIMVEIISTR